MLKVALVLFALAPTHALAFCDDAPYQVIKMAPCASDEISIYGVCHEPAKDQRLCNWNRAIAFRWKGVCVRPVWEDCKRVS